MKTTNNKFLPSWGRRGMSVGCDDCRFIGTKESLLGGCHLAFKSLWSRRKRNAWLFAELILVTIVCWWVLDPVIVTLYHKNLPLGYDKDRLCLVGLGIDISLYKPGDNFEELQEQFIKRFKTDFTTADVEYICTMGQRYLESPGGQSNLCYSDTTKSVMEQVEQTNQHTTAYVRHITFVKGEPFLETHGIKMLYGEEDTKRYIQNPDLFGTGDNVIVISRATAKWYFGKDDAVGEYLYYHNNRKVEVDGHDEYLPYNHPLRIIGVYDDVRTSESRHDEFTRLAPERASFIVVRLKAGANVEAYCNMVREKTKDNYAVGCIGLNRITSYDQLMDENSYNSGYTNKLRFNIALAALFLFSLSLGVIGTFWMQTKQRRGEVGVMRSFGASRNSIMRMIVSEGAMLATASVVIGCLIYLQYAIKEGLNLGFYNSMENEDGTPLTVSIENASNLDWVNTFGDHFLIVSAIIYLIILAVVIIGVSIPAKRLSSIPPVDALREE